MHGVGAANGVGAALGKTDMLDVAGLHHVGDGTDGVFDRHRWIEPRRPVDVDVIDAKPLQRIGEEVPHRCRAAVVTEPRPGRVAQRAKLDADLNIVAASPGERLADQHLIVAHAVEVAGIEQRDARFQRGMDGGDALAAVGRAVKIRHSHAAETDRGDFRAGCAQFALIHRGSPNRRRRMIPRLVTRGI